MTEIKPPACRPLVGVYTLEKSETGFTYKVTKQCPLPDVFNSPIRNDLVSFVHNQLSRNRRQPYAVTPLAGINCSAESWGTGRAVARIPRIKGSGSHRASQGAYGNMCRGGHMFNPTTTWRRWHRRVNRVQRRHAVVSALAASALPSLVLARGHQIMNIPELPLVIDSSSPFISQISKTKSAVEVLKAFGVYSDVTRCKESKKVRVGKGKMRNRRHVISRGPLIIHTFTADSEFVKSFRNLPGLELIHVDRLNLLRLSPGGHLGRLLVWTSDAMERLRQIYPDSRQVSSLKKDYTIARPILTMPDISRIINSDEVQKVLRPKIKKVATAMKKKNPLKNYKVMDRLNPLYFKLKKLKSSTHKTVPTPQLQQQVVV